MLAASASRRISATALRGDGSRLSRPAHDAQLPGRAAHVRFWWETASGLVTTAFREHREILFQDVDYALRMMRKDMAFTCIVVVILGLAIGAGTAAFSAANAILIQPLPFSGGNHLIHLKQRQPAVGVDNLLFSVKEIEDYRAQNHTLDSVVEFHEMTFSLLGGREPERVDTGVVSANFFRVLGVSPLYGRTFMDEDDRPNARPVLVLSYKFWQRSFGWRSAVVGQTYSMNDKQHVVVGILPPIPQFPGRLTFTCRPRPARPGPGEHACTTRSWHMMNVFATLKPGVSLARGASRPARHRRAFAEPLSRGLSGGEGIRHQPLQPVHEELARDIRPVLIVLAAAAGLLLLLACSNVAGMMLSRMLARTARTDGPHRPGRKPHPDHSQFRDGRHFAGGGGGVLGLLLAFWSLDVLVRFTAKFTSLSSQLRFAPQVIAFCFVLSLALRRCHWTDSGAGLRQTPSVHDGTRQRQPVRRGSARGARNPGGGAIGALGHPAGGSGPHAADA